jgi:hypothetical protein
MSDKKTTTILIDKKLHELAKLHGIGIGKCAEEGIKIKLGMVQGKEKLIEEIEKSEQKTEYLKSQMKELEALEVSDNEAILSEEAMFNKAVEECLREVTENGVLGRDKIEVIALKRQVTPELLIAEMEKHEKIEISNFHPEVRETKQSAYFHNG